MIFILQLALPKDGFKEVVRVTRTQTPTNIHTHTQPPLKVIGSVEGWESVVEEGGEEGQEEEGKEAWALDEEQGTLWVRVCMSEEEQRHGPLRVFVSFIH